MNNGDRILHVLRILNENTDEKHPIKTSKLIEMLESDGIPTDRKTVYRVIETLNDNGCDVIPTRVPEAGYFIGSRTFEDVEIRLLIDAVLAASFISQKKTDQLIKKLESLVSVHQAKEIHSHVFIDNRVKSKNEHIYRSIDSITDAIDRKRMITLTYTRGQSERTHTVSPYAMAWNKDKFYLIGNISNYDNLIHLRLDRISNVNVTNEPARPFSQVSEYKNYFDSADYVSQHINMFGGEAETIELMCTNKGYEMLIDQFEPTASVKKDDGVYVRIKAASGQGMVDFLAQCGREIKVISPGHLIDSLKEHIEQTLALYENK